MTDRLTQLQICVDQLIEQFNATVNYVNVHSEQAPLDEDPSSVTNIAASAPVAGQVPPQPTQPQTGQTSNGLSDHPTSHESEGSGANFDNTINELSTDIILKSRQISMLIDSLPGVGISEDSQMQLIKDLSVELQEVESERIQKIHQKDELLKWVEGLILEVASGISNTK
ncbi:hypothetical protein CANTEDRAFT_97109 [Yamadazyma tenuis ATCC 10573]|uniref:Mediator of RNA polymerase II transcription subunit 21 n=1 Tax=Candida tenuis (strain ATCC 10573 / BCRC 21748 / CBS 615 / JCM 9827 / NBRC 10315 / NRRL Y-1498 / VKM Y-70) TaxID=590646 RepID=G3AZA5_CANTC|nr:uncharacterized protein CANTEDRAFT_97109 [Yamadazyma tenuis ATCC 10573]EGV66049.1 hypothetical protein CANTEDRAFT_97109 [Yamadazyma tenuis ATCC 10573]